MVELSLEERYRRALAGDAMMLGTIVKAVHDKFGPQALEAMRQAMEASSQAVAAVLAKQVGARIGDGDVTDVAKIAHLIDSIQGIDSQWVELTPQRGMIRARSCLAAAQYRRYFPEFCPSVLSGLELGIAKVINPRMVAYSTGKYLSRGDDCCEIVYELK